jgi:hypothetical protein
MAKSEERGQHQIGWARGDLLGPKVFTALAMKDTGILQEVSHAQQMQDRPFAQLQRSAEGFFQSLMVWHVYL